MSAELKIWLVVGISFVGCIFLTRWLSMKEQKAKDEADFTMRIASAVESVQVEYYRRFETAVKDTMEKISASAPSKKTQASPGTLLPARPIDSTRCCAEADSLRMANLGLLAERSALAAPDSATFTMKDGAVINVWHRTDLETLERFFRVAYAVPPRQIDSTVVTRIKEIPVEIGFTTIAVAEFSVAAALIVEIIRFIITGHP